MTTGLDQRVPRLRNFIDGVWRDASNGAFTILTEPARSDNVLWLGARSTAEDAQDAAAAAGQAFHGWRKSSAHTRAGILLEAARVLRSRSERVIDDLAREQGKTRKEARFEVESAMRSLEYFSGHAMMPIGDMLPRSSDGARVWTERVPIGPTVCITPWNFPILIPTYKVAAALVYGNTVVLKPASLTPASAVHLVEALVEAGLPAGVLNLCLGDGARLSGTLLKHPEVRGISFTGSNPVGCSIAALGAERLLRVQLELGGKNPIVVLEDADLSRATRMTVEGAMGMAGQRCTATSLAIVIESIYGPYLSALKAQVGTLRIGHPLDPETSMGPVISGGQQQTILAAIERASASGARLIVGGGVAKGPKLTHGYFVEPTVFSDVDPRSELVQEEIFGPVLAVLPAQSIDKAIELANATRFGLTVSLCTNDLTAALRFIEGVESGIVQINRPTNAVERYAPFGGTKSSGLGAREQGLAARDFFTEWKTVYVGEGVDGGT